MGKFTFSPPPTWVVLGVILIVLAVGYYKSLNMPVALTVTKTARGHVLTFTPNMHTAAVEDDETKFVSSITSVFDPATKQSSEKLNPNMKAGDAGTIYYMSNGQLQFRPDPK